jgi:hypothetical protein
MININKLFRRLSIRAKLVIAFCLIGVVPEVMVSVTPGRKRIFFVSPELAGTDAFEVQFASSCFESSRGRRCNP